MNPYSRNNFFIPWVAGPKADQRGFPFDLFISYGSEDAPGIVWPLTKALKARGIRYFLDSEQIGWGESVQHRISYGLSSSRYVLAVITIHSLQKNWVRAELQAALQQQIAEGTTKVLPMIAGTAWQRVYIFQQLPLLYGFRYIEWRNNPAELVQLLANRLHH